MSTGVQRGAPPHHPEPFPNNDIQLCTVHMQRNAKTHRHKTDAAEFQQRWRAIKSSWNLEVANQQFEQLCDRFANFIAELRKKRQYYLAFLNYPESIRCPLSTTNVAEAVNGQLEIMRRNSGGYFHSEDVLIELITSSLRKSVPGGMGIGTERRACTIALSAEAFIVGLGTPRPGRSRSCRTRSRHVQLVDLFVQTGQQSQ